jgi:hypothetical protein
LPPSAALPFERLSPGQACPVTPGERSTGSEAVRLGPGPVYPVSGSVANGLARSQELIKILWQANSSYRGPVRVRGTRIDAPGDLFLNQGQVDAGPQLKEVVREGRRYLLYGVLEFPGLAPETAPVVRTWPSYTFVEVPGCYAWIVEGTDFTLRIVFQVGA